MDECMPPKLRIVNLANIAIASILDPWHKVTCEIPCGSVGSLFEQT